MKYVEIGATYKVQIPKDYVWSDGQTPKYRSLDNYRAFWSERKITITAHYKDRPSGIAGSVYGRAGFSYIEEEWLGDLVRHCPQVEHYIKSQEKENYTSPITGKIQ